MSDETVEHRFIQIHQACESASKQEADFWSSLTLKSTSAIAASHVCEKIYSKVINSELDTLFTIQNLQNLIITCSETPKNIVFLRVITRLLIFNTTNRNSLLFGRFKYTIKDPFGNSIEGDQEYQVHPFALIMRQKPSLYYTILDEIDFLFANFKPTNIMSTLSGFITAIFLTENSVDVGALIFRLSNNVTEKNAQYLIKNMHTLAISLLCDYPLHKDDQRYFCLVDWISWLAIFHPFTIRIDGRSHLYALVDRLLTAVTDGKSGMPYLIRLERIMKAWDNNYNFHVIWTSFAYALLKVQTIEEQKFTARIMFNMEKMGDASAIILRTAYIPLYQLLSELNDKDASKDLVELKKNVLNLIAFIDSNDTPFELGDADDLSSKLLIDKDISLVVYGMLGRLTSYLDYIYYYNKAPLLDPGNTAGTDSMLTLAMIFSTPFVFSEDDEEACLVYTRIAEISSFHETSYKFPILLFFLRRLHASSGNARMATHILKDAIPTLVNVNDPIITSKVLQVILTSINNSGSSNSAMASLGIKALAHIHELQPRVWQELKKVFAEWVLRRKSGTVRRKIDLTKTGPIKMELTVLTTMRDVCKTRPRECAPDVLPMIISLLQTCQDLSMASLSIIVDIINTCVQAGLVESRSIWNIAVVYLAQFALDQGAERSVLLVKQLCHFYSIAGAKNDVSEPYLQYKESLLKDYILPLIEPQNKDAISHAVYALSKFSAQDIAIILPEKAMDYVLQCTPENNKPEKNQHKVLAALMSNELDHMRRGLFKEEAKQQQQKSVVKVEDKLEITNDVGEVVGEREIEMEKSFINSWEDARVAPGFRSGYAAAILHILDNKNSPSTTKGAAMEAISKTKWYRYMVTSFTDVSLTDHLLVRVSSIKSWEVFFKNALSGVESDMETIVSLLLKDLLSRLERSTVPGVTCNITLAITGLVSTVRLFIPSFAASCAHEVIDVLMKNYIVLSGSPLSHSAHLVSEEVQFAARFVLGHLAAFITNNEKLTSTLHNVLMDAVSTNNKSRNINTAVDLVQFANGYAAGHFIASLSMWPTVTDQIENMKNTGMGLLIEHCSSPIASDSRVLGILMGLASKLKPGYMAEELSFAIDNLKAYLAGESVNKGLLFGSTWLAATGALQENQIDYEISGIVESVMTAASNDIDSAQHFYNFSVPYTQIQLHSYLYGDVEDSQTETDYWNAFEPLLTSIQNDDASSNYRIASLFSLGSLLGVNYLNSDDDNSVYTESERYRPALRQRALDKLAYVAGLNSKSAPIGNLKSGRIAAAVCGKVIGSTKSMIYALGAAGNAEDVSAEKSTMSLLSASSEPVSYSRLNSNTSYIRAVFDRLVGIISNGNQLDNITMLLNSLIETPGPLPPVNWFNLITKISKLSTSIQALCLSFASVHATTSLSLSEFLLTQMVSIFSAVQSITTLDKILCEAFFVGQGFGTVLELAGLPCLVNETKEGKKRRGMNAVIKRITISESRAIEIIEILGQKFEYFDYNMQYALLSNLAEHLPSSSDVVDESKAKFISSIRGIIMQTMTFYIFDHASEIEVAKSEYEKVVRQSVACSFTDISELFPTGKLEDWKDISGPTASAKIIALCEFYRLYPSKKQQLTKYISTAMVHSISMGFDNRSFKKAWHVIAEMMREDDGDKNAFVWMIRVFDAFVVYLGSIPQFTEDCKSENFEFVTRDVLDKVLMSFQVTISVDSCRSIKKIETAYALGNFIAMANEYSAEQEQIVKRIFKIRDMTEGLLFSRLYDKIIRCLPSEIVTQYESKYYY